MKKFQLYGTNFLKLTRKKPLYIYNDLFIYILLKFRCEIRTSSICTCLNISFQAFAFH